MLAHVDVEPVDDVVLLPVQERAVSCVDLRGVAPVDLLPCTDCRAVDYSGESKRSDRFEASFNVGLMHQRLVLKDLALHRQKCRLEEPEVAYEQLLCPRVAAESPPEAARARRDKAPHVLQKVARLVGKEPDVEEACVERRSYHVRQASPLEPWVVEVEPAVVVIDAFDRPPVHLGAARRVPFRGVNLGLLKRAVEPISSQRRGAPSAVRQSRMAAQSPEEPPAPDS